MDLLRRKPSLRVLKHCSPLISDTRRIGGASRYLGGNGANARVEGSGNGDRCRGRQQRDDQASRRNGQHEQLNDSVVHVKALLGLEGDWKLAVTTDSKSSWVISARI